MYLKPWHEESYFLLPDSSIIVIISEIKKFIQGKSICNLVSYIAWNTSCEIWNMNIGYETGVTVAPSPQINIALHFQCVLTWSWYKTFPVFKNHGKERCLSSCSLNLFDFSVSFTQIPPHFYLLICPHIVTMYMYTVLQRNIIFILN